MERRVYGSGSITKKGYIRYCGHGLHKSKFQHRRVWEEHNGPVPDGFCIHHLDGNKKNNDIENLALIDALTHKRIHSGCELRDGEWWKPCRECGEYKKVGPEDWYFIKKGTLLANLCKKCYIKEVVTKKQKRKSDRKMLLLKS